MHCVEVTAELLAADGDMAVYAEVQRHVRGCAHCARVAAGLGRLNGALRTTLVVAPPLALQRQLQQLVVETARPATQPWWQRLRQLDPSAWLAQRPHMVAAQGLAAAMLALASWQMFGWFATYQPVVGDVGYAVQLVAASPAATYFGGLQIDVQSLGLWTIVGIVGWLVSEDGLLGRRLTSIRPRLP